MSCVMIKREQDGSGFVPMVFIIAHIRVSLSVTLKNLSRRALI